jgi:hypothetical protein
MSLSCVKCRQQTYSSKCKIIKDINKEYICCICLENECSFGNNDWIKLDNCTCTEPPFHANCASNFYKFMEQKKYISTSDMNNIINDAPERITDIMNRYLESYRKIFSSTTVITNEIPREIFGYNYQYPYYTNNIRQIKQTIKSILCFDKPKKLICDYCNRKSLNSVYYNYDLCKLMKNPYKINEKNYTKNICDTIKCRWDFVQDFREISILIKFYPNYKKFPDNDALDMYYSCIKDIRDLEKEKMQFLKHTMNDRLFRILYDIELELQDLIEELNNYLQIIQSDYNYY